MRWIKHFYNTLDHSKSARPDSPQEKPRHRLMLALKMLLGQARCLGLGTPVPPAYITTIA